MKFDITNPIPIEAGDRVIADGFSYEVRVLLDWDEEWNCPAYWVDACGNGPLETLLLLDIDEVFKPLDFCIGEGL